MKEEVKKWWKLAKKDLDAADYNFKGKKYYVTIFLCEQAVEKAFKALWLKEKKSEIPKIHNLLFFLRELKVPQSFKTTCEDLTGAYITSRYSADIESKFSKIDTKSLLKNSKEILKWTKKKL